LLPPQKPDINFGVFFLKKISLEISQSENAKCPLNLCIFEKKLKITNWGKLLQKTQKKMVGGLPLLHFFQ
jgi:hypothetical protein